MLNKIDLILIGAPSGDGLTIAVFKVVLLVCIVLLVGLILKVEMAAGHALRGRILHAMTTAGSHGHIQL